MIRRAALLALLCSLALATPARPQAAARHALARHVILFLADAGGLATLHAASLLGTGSPRGLFVQQMPHIALIDTSAADAWVTDSAAGMTAIVTGRKTNNGVLAETPDAVRNERDGTPLQSILRVTREPHGLSTGVVTNDSIAGATPAALYAKANDRGKAAEIVLQAFSPRHGDGVDVMIGAGRTALTQAVAEAGHDLPAIAAAAGHTLRTDVSEVPPAARRALVLYEDGDFDLAAAVRHRAQGAGPQYAGLVPHGRI